MFVCSVSVAQFVSIPIWKALFNKFSFNHQLLSRGWIWNLHTELKMDHDWLDFRLNFSISFCFIILFITISTVTSQQERSGFEFTGWLGTFCVEFACSSCVGSLQVVQLPPTDTHLELMGVSKLAVGVKVSMNDSLSLPLCQPFDTLATCQGCTPLLAKSIQHTYVKKWELNKKKIRKKVYWRIDLKA